MISALKPKVIKVIRRVVDKYGWLRALYTVLIIALRIPRTLWLTWRGKSYSQFYRAWQDKQALRDPKIAVGGPWVEVGRFQFDLLIDQGLQPQHQLLDLGCGSLRGGLRFIPYLKPGNYYGMDISPNILEAGRHFLVQAGLESREPHLIVNHNLKFDELAGVTFDYIIAYSVFTHMPKEDIEECFANLHKIIKISGIFCATFAEGKSRWYDKASTIFYYPFSFFQQLGDLYGYQVQRLDDWHDPTGGRVLRIEYQT
jgi:SAM-dependent methyltransferase